MSMMSVVEIKRPIPKTDCEVQTMGCFVLASIAFFVSFNNKPRASQALPVFTVHLIDMGYLYLTGTVTCLQVT